MLSPILPADLITLAEAAAILPRKKTGKRVCVSTIRRWGLRGRIKLFQCNGLKVSETELRSKFRVRVVALLLALLSFPLSIQAAHGGFAFVEFFHGDVHRLTQDLKRVGLGTGSLILPDLANGRDGNFAVCGFGKRLSCESFQRHKFYQFLTICHFAVQGVHLSVPFNFGNSVRIHNHVLTASCLDIRVITSGHYNV